MAQEYLLCRRQVLYRILHSRPRPYRSFLFVCLVAYTSAAALAQQPDMPVAVPNISLSASVTVIEKETKRSEAKLGLSIELTELSPRSTAPPVTNSRSMTLPRSSLLTEQGQPKDIELVVWSDPSYFTAESDRHGLLDLTPSNIFSQHNVLTASDSSDNTHPNRLRLILRKGGPSDGTATVGVLLLADGELVTDFALPFDLSQKPIAMKQAIDSPFRPKTLPGIPSSAGVLTLVEVEPKIVQLTFACATDIESWRVKSALPLKEWPHHVAGEIAERNRLKSAGTALSYFLFPDASDSDKCLSNCAAATSLFETWATQQVERPLSLTVQALPLGGYDTRTPLFIPVGMLPIPIATRAYVEPELTSASLDDPLLNGSGSLAAIEFSSKSEEAVPIATELLDPADPKLAINWLGSTVLDPALPQPAKYSLAPSPAGPKDPIDSKFEANQDIMPLSPDGAQETLADVADPADPSLEINRSFATAKDPVTPFVERIPSTWDDEQATAYLAYKAIAHVPVYRSRAVTTSRACNSAWTMLIPSDYDGDGGILNKARKEMSVFLDIWRDLSLKFRPKESLQYLESSHSGDGALLVISHYQWESGNLWMPTPRPQEPHYSVNGSQVRLQLASPGLVVLLACEGALPGPDSVLDPLIKNGATTLIVTNSVLPSDVAGQFAANFITVLGEAGPSGMSVADAFWETLKRIRKDIVPRFVLAGNPNVHLCAPPLVR